MKIIIKFILKLGSLICGLIFTFSTILFVMFSSDTHGIYKANWGIDIPNPQKEEYITADDRHSVFQIMNYKEKDIQKLKEKNFMQKINVENIDSLNKDYEKLIENLFIRFLNREERKILYEKDLKKLFNEDNYYALIEKNERYSNDYKFLFLLLDSEQNVMYSLEYSAYVR